MQPHQYDLRCPAAKDESSTHAAAAPSNATCRDCEKKAFVRDLPQNLKVEGVKAKLSCETSLRIWKLKVWKQSFRARRPSKSESGKCENEAFVQDFLQIPILEDVKMKLSCETSLEKWKWKMWKRSFPARPPSKSESWRCENEAFVRDLPQKVNVENMKSKLSCDTSLKKWKWKKWKWKMWNQSFRARPPSKSERGRYENGAFVRDFRQNRQIPKVEEVKTKLSRETSLKIWKWKMWKRSSRARLPPDSDSWRCENKAFVRDLCQIRTVEDVKTKLSWETSVKIVKIGSDSWRYENKAFVRDLPQKVKVEDVKTKLSCKTSFKFWKFKLNKTMPETAVPLRGPSDHDPSTPEPFRNPPAGQASPSIFRDRFCPAIHSISCIRYLSKTHFVRDFPQRVKVEDVKTKLSCETSLKIWKGQIWKRWKMWKRSFRARLPPDSDSWRCENEAFVRDLPQNLKVEDVKAKLSCETSLKIWKWKMWKRSSRARLPPDSDSWRCENTVRIQRCSMDSWNDLREQYHDHALVGQKTLSLVARDVVSQQIYLFFRFKSNNCGYICLFTWSNEYYRV